MMIGEPELGNERDVSSIPRAVQPPPPPVYQRWEHNIVQCLSEGTSPTQVMKKQGDAGWQLAAALLSNDGRFVSLFFKRPVL